MWLATVTWGIVLTGGLPIAPKKINPDFTLSRNFLSGAAILAAILVYSFSNLINTLIILVAISAFVFGRFTNEFRWLRSLMIALVISALVSVLIALIQLLYPTVEFVLIAPLANANRATANLRQPNLFAQLLLLSLVANLFLCEYFKNIPRWIVFFIAFSLGAGLTFSQSRTGFLGLLILLGWALWDKNLPAFARKIPIQALLGCLTALAVMLFLAHSAGKLTHFELQQGEGSDISASRFGIWSNSLQLISMYPLTGVGWGNFAKAWVLTPFPDRPTAAFDNAHNLPLHLMVELGIPLASLLMGLAAWSIWRARWALKFQILHEKDVLQARCLFMILSMLAIHSLLEYPLWYTFFLFPAAFIAGQFLQLGARARHRKENPLPDNEAKAIFLFPSWCSIMMRGIGMTIVFVSIFAVWDYSRVMQAFKPFGAGIFEDLQTRIDEGRKSRLFGYWIDYAVTIDAESFQNLDEQVRRAFENRMNPHFLKAYALYLNERGQTDKAIYVAERLREFKGIKSGDFFAECDDLLKSSKLFQCQSAKGKYTFKDFN